MNENIDFIILEHDEGTGCALIAGAVDGVVPAIDGYNTPYVVAKGYDHATREWEDCTLFDDIGKAKLAYERLRRWEHSLRSDFYPDFYPERLVEIAEADVALHGSPIPRVLIPRDCPAFKLGDSVDAWNRRSELLSERMRRLRAPLNCDHERESHDPQSIAAAAAKAAEERGEDAAKRGGYKHQ